MYIYIYTYIPYNSSYCLKSAGGDLAACGCLGWGAEAGLRVCLGIRMWGYIGVIEVLFCVYIGFKVQWFRV